MANKNEVVVITGASAGIGRATVCEFARHGARIGLLARGRAGLEGAKKDAERRGGEAVVLPTDVADPKQVEAAAAEVEKRFGPIDVWVNDAMASVFSPFKEMTAEEFRRVTEVTYLGFVYGTMAALERMIPRDRGTIVQVGSALAYRSIPLAAQAIYWAAHHDRRELLVGKSTVMAVTGQKFIPGLLDQYLGRTGYDSQQHDGREDPSRPDNLWQPVDDTRDHGAHGAFDSRAKDLSSELWVAEHKGLVAGLAVALAGGLGALLSSRAAKSKYEEREYRYPKVAA
jgi:short-subunit dehydrogenase involved in D-alanine esterification of teichoic acids